MANTTNFNWETPDDTDLVKDGAAAIRTLGSAIDTSLVDLKGGTTNQVLAKNSDTDMDFKWVADASGIPATIFDAKGDLIVASAADTAARLAVGGTNGHVLTVNSGATNGIEWAAASSGAMTKIASNTFSTAATVDVDNVFTSTYWSYVIKVWCWQDGGVGPDTDLYFRLRYGGTTQASAYSAGGFSWDRNDTAATAMNSDNAAQWMLTNYTGSADNDSNYFTINISGVAVNGRYANFHAIGGGKASAEGQFIITGGRINVGQNWDGFRLLPSSGTIAGGYEVYGLQK
jgi:hypothetical protein